MSSDDLARARLRVGNLLELEDVQAPELVEHDCLHAATSPLDDGVGAFMSDFRARVKAEPLPRSGLTPAPNV